MECVEGKGGTNKDRLRRRELWEGRRKNKGAKDPPPTPPLLRPWNKVTTLERGGGGVKARESEGAGGPAVVEVGQAAEGGSSDATERRGPSERGREGDENDSSAPFLCPPPSRPHNASVAPLRVWYGSASPVPSRNRWEFLGIP